MNSVKSAVVPKGMQNFLRTPAFKILVAAIVVALLIVAYWFVQRPVLFPAELNSAIFISPAPDSVAYVSSQKGFVVISPQGSSVIDATHGATNGVKHDVFLLMNKQGTYSLSVDGAELATSTNRLQNVSLSPDSTKVAYTLRIDHATSTEPHVVVLTRATKKTQDLGIGLAPLFLGDAHLIYYGADGVRFHDLGNNFDYIVNAYPFQKYLFQAVGSPNRKKFGWQTGDNSIRVFSVEHVSPLKFQYEGVGSTTPNAIYNLGDEAIYEVRQNNGMSEVWKRVAVNQKPVKIYIFPKGMTISRITF